MAEISKQELNLLYKLIQKAYMSRNVDLFKGVADPTAPISGEEAPIRKLLSNIDQAMTGKTSGKAQIGKLDKPPGRDIGPLPGEKTGHSGMITSPGMGWYPKEGKMPSLKKLFKEKKNK